MQYDKKVMIQQVLRQILDQGPLDKNQIKKQVIRVGIRIGMQAAVRYLHYHSMKGLYNLRKYN